jgi:glutaconyl-CoA/methylmalonyl-CoA decarboxylase subunit gamma
MKKFVYKIDGNKYEVVVNSVEAGEANIEVNGKAIKVAIEQEETIVKPVQVKRSTASSSAAPVAAAPRAAASKGAVISPLPGTITKIMVSAGQSLKRGDILLTMEAMKMENSIPAERDCTVKAILVQQGQSVMQGDALVDIE